MRSQAVLAFRAVVMLSVLVLIPLVAVFGPQMLQFLGGLLPQRSGPTEITAQTSAGSMSGGQSQDSGAPVGPWDPRSVRPPSGRPSGGEVVDQAVSQWPPESVAKPQTAPGGAASTAFHERPVQRFVPVSPPQGLPAQAAAAGRPLDGNGTSSRVGGKTRPVDSGVVAASHFASSTPSRQAYPHQAAPAGTPQVRGSGVQAATGDTDLAQDSRFVRIQRRLRELGATYYVLETWGEGGELLRFYCRMAVAGNPACNRYFEATDADPLKAMAKVLTEVESWRAARP